LSTARTNMGKQCLARWLLKHAGVEEIQDRQAAVAELKSRLDFREDLAVTGETERIAAKPEALIAWSREESGLQDGRWWAAGLAILCIAALIFGFEVMWTPFVLLLLVNGIITSRARHRLEKIFAGIGNTHKDLGSLALLLQCIEAKKFESPMLQQLQAQLLTHGLPPSACIARLDTLADLDDSRHNWFVRVFDIPLLYSMQIAFALERWRRTYGGGIEAWLQVVGEIETLASIAAYSYEHPQDPFPEFVPPQAEICLQGDALGHPLLAADKCVRNDVRLGGNSQVLLVSGSNMSGKSTYLRVVGVNAVLAMMGAPVRAASLRLSPLVVGASMRVSDSLQKGISHFYAEIKRLRQVVDLSSTQPTLFLLDEVLQGTNSHDRRVGTEGVLRTLVRNGAIGLITTHDLALTSLEQVFPAHVRNIHFQERFEDDRLSFDYRLRPGVVTTSNGIELMKSIGLDVS
ncbi:MAG: mismatch repair protein, partial [Candidatus Angelobacter sp.]